MGSARKAQIERNLQKSAREHPQPKGTFGQLEKKVGSERLAGFITNNLRKGNPKRAGGK